MGYEVPGALEQTSRLLWEACRRDPDKGAVERALAEGADTDMAIAVAAEQGLEALLWRALSSAGACDSLGPQGMVLRAVADARRMEALLLIPDAVARAVRPLTEAGLMPIVFKGPAVASRYPEPGLRPMGDIDLLLPATDHRRALEVLLGADWRIVRDGGTGHYDTVLLHDKVPSLALELHFGLEPSTEQVTSIDASALWERRVPASWAGSSAFGLSQADELVVLAAHAGKPFHGFTRLIWIADFAMIIGAAAARDTPIDWDAVRATAERARCLTVVGAALAMARHAGVESPRDLFPMPKHGWRGQTLRQLLSVTWPMTTRELHRFQLTYALTDAPAQRLRSMGLTIRNWHGLEMRVQATGKALRHPLKLRRAMTPRWRYASADAGYPRAS
jgi:hypothetical protein